MIQWPSKRIPQGGVYHPPKVQYSPETANFLKTLIDESKLSIQHRNKLNYSLRSGEPFPPLHSETKKKKGRIPPVKIRPGSSKRRSLNTIIQSGAYERDTFVPSITHVDREKEKNHLQSIMAYGKDVEPTPRKPKKEEREPIEYNRFDELMKEIKEREEWLEEMEKLGEGYKYRLLIKQQIEDRLRQMEKLKVATPPHTPSKRSPRI